MEWGAYPVPFAQLTQLTLVKQETILRHHGINGSFPLVPLELVGQRHAWSLGLGCDMSFVRSSNSKHLKTLDIAPSHHSEDGVASLRTAPRSDSVCKKTKAAHPHQAP